MPLHIRAEKPAGDANDLTPAQVDLNWQSLYRSPVEVTVIGGVLPVNGQGVYTVDTQNDDPTDELTDITGLPAGEIVILRAANAGRATTLVHGTNLRLQGEVPFTLDTPYSSIRLRSFNGTIVYEESRAAVP